MDTLKSSLKRKRWLDNFMLYKKVVTNTNNGISESEAYSIASELFLNWSVNFRYVFWFAFPYEDKFIDYFIACEKWVNQRTLSKLGIPYNSLYMVMDPFKIKKE